MPRNSSGVYTLPLPPVVAGTTITSNWANTTLDDVTASLTDSLDRYGRGGMVAPFRLVDGTEALPSFAFNAETGSGLFRASTGVVGMSILGTARQEWTSSGVAVLDDFAVTGGVDVSAGMTVHGAMEVMGAVALDNNLGVGGNLGVVGTSTLTGNVGMSGQLVVAGPTLINNTLNVTGTSTLAGISGTTLSLSGSLTVAGTPVTPGAYVLKAGDTMTGALTINSGAAAQGATFNSTATGGAYAGWQSAGNSLGYAGGALALMTGWTGESPAALEFGLRGQAGLWMSVNNVPFMHTNSSGQTGFGGMPQNNGMTVRNDLNSLGTGAGGTLTLSNKVSTASSHIFGSVLFDAFRDVSSPSYVAGMWAQGTSPSGNTVDLMFGTAQNGGTGFPAERMRIAMNGMVGIGGGFAPTQLLHLQQTNGNANVMLEAVTTGGAAVVMKAAAGYPQQVQFSTPAGGLFAVGAGAIGTGGANDFAIYNYVKGTTNLIINGASGVITDQSGNELGWRRLPAASIVSGTVVASDSGKCVYASGNVTFPRDVFTQGDVITVVNQLTSTLSMIQGAANTMTLAGSGGSIGNRTLAGNGICTVIYNNATSCTISGNVS